MSDNSSFVSWLYQTMKNSSTHDSDDGSGPVKISLLHLGMAVLPLVLISIGSIRLGLGLGGKMAIATLRCTIQLSVLGWILVPIFMSNSFWLTISYACFMLFVASAEAVARPSHSYSGVFFTTFLGLGLACSLAISFALALVLDIKPFYNAQYMIPILGMLLGNACSTASVGLSAVFNEFAQGKESVEVLLAFGASRIEATSHITKKALQMALTPLLSSMNVVGIVSIPGMMTGQILGGSDPAVAARYQIAIFFWVAFCSSISSAIVIYAAVFNLCDRNHRLKSDALHSKSKSTAFSSLLSFLGKIFSWNKNESLPLQTRTPSVPSSSVSGPREPLLPQH